MPKVITANKLTSGIVVFYSPEGAWAETIDDAVIYDDMPAAEAGLLEAKRDEAKAIVVDPFIVDQTSGQDGRSTMSLRDTIRAYGPTIAFAAVDARTTR